MRLIHTALSGESRPHTEEAWRSRHSAAGFVETGEQGLQPPDAGFLVLDLRFLPRQLGGLFLHYIQ
jgi:hypothetical protein